MKPSQAPHHGQSSSISRQLWNTFSSRIHGKSKNCSDTKTSAPRSGHTDVGYEQTLQSTEALSRALEVKPETPSRSWGAANIAPCWNLAHFLNRSERASDRPRHANRTPPQRTPCRARPPRPSAPTATANRARRPPAPGQDRIMVSIILKRFSALSACGRPAGMRIISPSCKR